MLKEIDKQTYEKFWREFNGSPLQSWAWGEVKKTSNKPLRLGFFKEGILCGVVTVFIKDFPYSTFFKIFGSQNYLYIPHGPVIARVDDLDDLLLELKDYFSKKGFAFLSIDPPVDFFNADTWNTNFRAALEKSGWKKTGVSVQPNQTDVVKVDKKEEEILSAMHPEWRRNIRRAIKLGVTVEEANSIDGLKDFYFALESATKSGKFKIHKIDYFQNIFNKLYSDNLVKFYLAKLNKKVVAGYMLLFSQKCAYEIYGGVTSEGRKVEASYLIKFEMMKDAGKLGKIYYDQWGVCPQNSTSHPLLGITKFKQGFGGSYRQLLPQYSAIYKKFIFAIFKLYRKFFAY